MSAIELTEASPKPRKTENPRTLRLFDENRALGLRGDLQWLPIETLNVDPIYQRPISSRHVNKIFRDFDGDLIGVILVSERPSGERYILDGQHRVEAVRMLEHTEALVPAMVYTHLTQETEAKIFADANKKRLALHPFYTFRARLVAGDPAAQEIKEIAERYGFHLDYGKALPGESSTGREQGRIQALGEIEKLHTAYAESMLGPVLELVSRTWGSDIVGLKGTFLRGLASFLHLYEGMYEQDRLAEILQNYTPKRLELEAKDESSRMEVGVPKLLVQRYNYHLGQKSRLPMRNFSRG